MYFAIRFPTALLAAALALLAPSVLAAQTPWFEPTRPEPAVGLEVFRPDFEGPADVGFATSALFF